MAQSFTASAPQWSPSCASSRVWPRVWIRGTARVFEIDPNTVLSWLGEAAEQLKAFAAYFLHELHLNQIQLDELYAVLNAVQRGDISAAEAIEASGPPLVWTAIAPESKCSCASRWGTAPWRWRKPSSIISRSCWRQAVCRSF